MINFSVKARTVVDCASALAVNTGGLVYTEHLLYGLLTVGGTAARRILDLSGVYRQDILSAFESCAPCMSVEMSPRAAITLERARQFATELGASEIGTEHILYAVLDDPESVANKLVRSLNVDPLHVQRLAYNVMVEGSGKRPDMCVSDGGVEGVDGVINGYKSAQMRDADYGERRAYIEDPANGELSKFGVDLTEKARNGKLDPVIGRDKETARVIQILCRRTKNNPVLVGEPGVGKTAIVDGLAIAIAEGKVPDLLKDKTVFSLDLSALVAGTRYRGDFEERLKNTLNAIKARGDIILFIDEIHTILKAGSSEGGLDIANILKPMLARGELTTIGATTIEEYRKQFEVDSALERRFQPVTVEEPSVADTILILQGLKSKYEAHHGVVITDEAISAAAILSDRYVRDRFLPDKAVDLIDEAAACKRLEPLSLPQNVDELKDKLTEVQRAIAATDDNCGEDKKMRLLAAYKEAEGALKRAYSAAGLAEDGRPSIGEDEVAKVVCGWTGIPVSKLSDSESERLAGLEDALKSRVIGQDAACSAVAKAVKRARAGLKDPKRPVGSFIFLGPTGVGKTELAKALAQALFGDEDMLIRVDMAEYMDKGSVSRLIGAAPGLVGFEEGGQLTEKVRLRPYSVVLFDEIEKGDSEIYNLLLQILEDGILTDSKGRTVNFKNAVIILTSNIGAKEASSPIRATGFGAQTDERATRRDRYVAALKEYMRPEIINRLDEIAVFEPLSREDMARVADIMLKDLQNRLDERGIKLKLSAPAKERVILEGFDPVYGARPLRRAIQRMLMDRLSEMMIAGELRSGDVVLVDLKDGELSFEKL